ncbi:MAG: hypothetical protein ABL933_03355 [Methyloglobulus sp.]|nr:hypothetical protein [Methyloglobulus sp.]
MNRIISTILFLSSILLLGCADSFKRENIGGKMYETNYTHSSDGNVTQAIRRENGDIEKRTYSSDKTLISVTVDYSNGDTGIYEIVNGKRTKRTVETTEYTEVTDLDSEGNEVSGEIRYANGDIGKIEFENGKPVRETITYTDGYVKSYDYDSDGNLDAVR